MKNKKATSKINKLLKNKKVREILFADIRNKIIEAEVEYREASKLKGKYLSKIDVESIATVAAISIVNYSK